MAYLSSFKPTNFPRCGKFTAGWVNLRNSEGKLSVAVLGDDDGVGKDERAGTNGVQSAGNSM